MRLSWLDTDMMARQTVVIVVDDDAGLLKSVARLLAHQGIESRMFASAEALIESGSSQMATCLLLGPSLVLNNAAALAIPSFFEIKESVWVRNLSEKNRLCFF